MSKPANPSRARKRFADVRRRFQHATFSLLYRAGGGIYDPLTRIIFGDAWDRWRTSVIPFLPEGPVLDLGCGTGVLVDSLHSMGYVAFGVDREPSMLRRARRRRGSRSRLVRADASALPFRSGQFAACVATFPSRFIAQRDTLEEIARVIRPGGTFAVVLSGYTGEWPLHRQPIRLALRLFYGPRDRDDLPRVDLFAHPNLRGEWRHLPNGPDHVLLWIGERSGSSDANG